MPLSDDELNSIEDANGAETCAEGRALWVNPRQVKRKPQDRSANSADDFTMLIYTILVACAFFVWLLFFAQRC